MNSGQNLDNLKKFIRAANYLTVAQIFLKDNFLLERPLEFSDIKPRLLGHWGSCPGVNVIYAHLLRAQSHLDFAKSNLKTAFMLGPGHAFPALQANLFLEETLASVDQKAQRNAAGIAYIAKNFSWPAGFPSHASPYTPGVILEGGELGYSLSTAFGAVLDNPNLIMATVIGDGEAETGAIASAWHLNKLVNPVENGVVLPILHLNKYKISGPTIFGTMSDFELIQYFHGAGWEPKIVDEYTAGDFNAELAKAMDETFRQIAKIKFGGKVAGDSPFVRLPMLIVRSKKGSGGVVNLHGEKIEGNSSSHQVPLAKAGSSSEELKMLEDWLKSYRFDELFDAKNNQFGGWIEDFLPEKMSRLGQNSQINGGKNFTQLNLPEVKAWAGEKSLTMNAIGEYLAQVFAENPENFRFFSPDETYSNKLDAIFSQTARAWQRKIEPWEKDLAPNGKVLEILNETSLQGLLQGYLLTGRHGFLTSYEAFAPIISSIMDQYAKFLVQSQDVDFRGEIASLNYILTSTGWRQDHNGFSHQNPSFIDEVLRRGNGIGQVFLPADANSGVVATREILATRDNISVLVAGKTPEPNYFSAQQAEKMLAQGGIFAYDLWRNAEFSTDKTDQPDLVLAASGDYVFKETVAAAQVLRHDFPELKVRLIYLSALHSGGIGTFKNPLSRDDFSRIFTAEKPIFFAFHGYPQTLKSLLFDFENPQRMTVNGYDEKGSTTTPFDMLARNSVSRYDIAARAIREMAPEKAAEYLARKEELLEYAREHSVDSPEIEEWEYLNFVK